MPYILEVQKFNINGHNAYPELNGKSEHIGYVNKVFKTKQEASNYYDTFNPHMRSLNAQTKWCSDWDSNSGLIRERFYEYLKIPAFENIKK